MMSVPINIRLSGHLVDNPRSSRADITLINSNGRLTIEAVQSDVADIHSFGIANSLNLGYPTALNSPDDVRDLLCLSVSISSKSIIFSKNLSIPLPYDIPVTASDQQGGRLFTDTLFTDTLFTDTVTQGPMTRLLELDEDQVFGIANELLMFKFSQPYGRSLADHNLYEAIQAYLDAADSLVDFTRRRHLWRALEKSVNSQKELMGEELDKEIALLTRLPEATAKKIREFENRTKHIARKHDDIESYMNFLDEEAMLTSLLKQVVDQVLIAKLEQRRKAIESQPLFDPPRHIVRTI